MTDDATMPTLEDMRLIEHSPIAAMSDTLPLVAWTDAQVRFVMEFIYKHRHANLWQDPKLVREMLEGAVQVRSES